MKKLRDIKKAHGAVQGLIRRLSARGRRKPTGRIQKERKSGARLGIPGQNSGGSKFTISGSGDGGGFTDYVSKQKGKLGISRNAKTGMMTNNCLMETKAGSMAPKLETKAGGSPSPDPFGAPDPLGAGPPMGDMMGGLGAPEGILGAPGMGGMGDFPSAQNSMAGEPMLDEFGNPIDGEGSFYGDEETGCCGWVTSLFLKPELDEMGNDTGGDQISWLMVIGAVLLLCAVCCLGFYAFGPKGSKISSTPTGAIVEASRSVTDAAGLTEPDNCLAKAKQKWSKMSAPFKALAIATGVAVTAALSYGAYKGVEYLTESNDTGARKPGNKPKKDAGILDFGGMFGGGEKSSKGNKK